MEMYLEGTQECLAKLDNISKKVNRGENEALKSGADVAKSYISAYTPVRTGAAVAGVSKGNVHTDSATGYKSIKVGYNSDVYWYMWFVSEGTYSKGNPKGISPRKHVDRAWEAGWSSINEAIVSELERLIDSL